MGMLGVRQEHTLGETPVHCKASCIYLYLGAMHVHVGFLLQPETCQQDLTGYSGLNLAPIQEIPSRLYEAVTVEEGLNE